MNEFNIEEEIKSVKNEIKFLANSNIDLVKSILKYNDVIVEI